MLYKKWCRDWIKGTGGGFRRENKFFDVFFRYRSERRKSDSSRLRVRIEPGGTTVSHTVRELSNIRDLVSEEVAEDLREVGNRMSIW